MIIQELNNLYLRLKDDPDVLIPSSQGWSLAKVSAEVVIALDGHIRSIIPYSSESDKRYIQLCVPEQSDNRTSQIMPFFLCDKPEYLVGIGDTNKQNRTIKLHESSKKLHNDVLKACEDAAATAIINYFNIDHSDYLRPEHCDLLLELKLLVFRLEGDRCYIHERNSIVASWKEYYRNNNEDNFISQCSVTGIKTEIARIFPQVTGFPGAQLSGASLVSFNKDAFNSYGRKQASNACISQEVAFNAGTALKYLCDKENGHRSAVGETAVVYWTDRWAPLEECFISQLFDDNSAEYNELRKRVSAAMDSLRQGIMPVEIDTSVRFFILGLAPNAARLSVRFFEQGTLGMLAKQVGQYLQDIDMMGVRPVTLYSYLLQVAPNGDGKNLPSTLINPCYTAILKGADFPRSLQSLLLSRMRADHAQKNSWDMGQRAALFKGCLVRRARFQGKECEVTVTLNKENNNIGYLLGRLFAVMEQAQWGAVGDTNATIRDRYIGAASSTPRRVFQPLMRNLQVHLGALRRKKPGFATKIERELDEIVGDKLPASAFPATLSQDDSAQFFVGYYQERTELRKRPETDSNTNESKTETMSSTN